MWRVEYESCLDADFENCEDEKEYITNVILCDDIDINHVQNIMIYFLLAQGDTKGLKLHDAFNLYYKNICDLTEEIKSQDIKSKLRAKQKRKISKYTIDDVDLMNGAEFEEFVGLLFKKMGYSAQVTKQSGDQGLDVIASKNGTKIGIQAKCYSNTVGNSAVQEAVAGKSFYNCDKVIVITNNYFTPAAIELAQSNEVILWNRDMLKEKIKELM